VPPVPDVEDVPAVELVPADEPPLLVEPLVPPLLVEPLAPPLLVGGLPPLPVLPDELPPEPPEPPVSSSWVAVPDSSSWVAQATAKTPSSAAARDEIGPMASIRLTADGFPMITPSSQCSCRFQVWQVHAPANLGAIQDLATEVRAGARRPQSKRLRTPFRVSRASRCFATEPELSACQPERRAWAAACWHRADQPSCRQRDRGRSWSAQTRRACDPPCSP